MQDAVKVDPAKVEQFSARIMEDYGNTLRGAMLYIGDRLGLFKSLAEVGAVTLEELAEHTGLNPRYLREWLGSMATGNYVTYDAKTRRYRMPPEFAPVLADEDSPYFAGGIIQLAVPFVSMAPKVLEAFRNGGGAPEESYPIETWQGMERMTMPWYKHHLVQRWIPSLDGVQEKLQAGASVLDFGCGSGGRSEATLRNRLKPAACAIARARFSPMNAPSPAPPCDSEQVMQYSVLCGYMTRPNRFMFSCSSSWRLSSTMR